MSSLSNIHAQQVIGRDNDKHEDNSSTTWNQACNKYVLGVDVEQQKQLNQESTLSAVTVHRMYSTVQDRNSDTNPETTQHLLNCSKKSKQSMYIKGIKKKQTKKTNYETHVFMTSNVYTKQYLVTKSDVLRVLHLPQTQASTVLKCSLSTLKRKFYEYKNEFQMEKWPQYLMENKHLPLFPYMYPMCITFILNPPMHKNNVYNPKTDYQLPYVTDVEVREHFLKTCQEGSYSKSGPIKLTTSERNKLRHVSNYFGSGQYIL